MNNIQKGLLTAFESSGLTYDELAKKTNLPKSALYRYLNGDTEKIPIDRFQAVCHELHVDAGMLLGWKEQPPEDPLNDQPVTPEARIISGGIDKMPPERRAQALAIMKAAFVEYADYFKEDHNDDA
ncbi:MAG: helix-turn-helix transcriptional regulator [Clostridia bacterium]|nr:helix-turn-helix transcriptional regulator [Clostridia bacterium]